MTTLEKVKRELDRLGAKLREPSTAASIIGHLSVVDVTRRTNWEKVDPTGELVDVSLAIRTFDAIEWPFVPFTLTNPDEPGRADNVDFYSGNENYEASDAKQRLVLYQFGYIETIDFTLAFNLLDRSDDPLVYRYTDLTETTDACPDGTFSEFLARVRVAAQGAS